MPEQPIRLGFDAHHGAFRRMTGGGKRLKVFLETLAVAADDQRDIGKRKRLSVFVPQDEIEQKVLNAREGCCFPFDAHGVPKPHGQVDKVVFFGRDGDTIYHRKLHPNIAVDEHQPIVGTAAALVAGVAVAIVPALQH